MAAKVPRINESLQSLQIYAAIIRASKPLTAREIMERTGIADGTLYPILDKRIAASIMIKYGPKRETVYDLTHEGLEKAKSFLLVFEIPVQAWIDTDRRFRLAPPGS